MGGRDQRRVDHAVLTVFLDDGSPLVYSLTSAQARQVALLAREYQAAKVETGGGRPKSRCLTRLESLACYDAWRHGASKLRLASDYGVSVAAVASAINRVKCGRYGKVPGMDDKGERNGRD